MKAFDKIVVLENDENKVPYVFNKILKNINSPIDYWFNFNNDKKDWINVFKLNFNNTWYMACPSFIGYDNSLENYLFLLIELQERNIPLHISIFFNNKFESCLKEYLNDSYNDLKRSAVHENIKNVLDFHNIYELNNSEEIMKNIKINYIDLL